jgi:hypothetical protein
MSKFHKVPTAGAAVLFALALTACGGGGSSSSAPAKTTPTRKSSGGSEATTTTAATKAAALPDPCVLVSQAQAQTLVVPTLPAGEKSGSGADTMCQYTSDPNGPTAQVSVFVGDGAKKALDIDKDSLQHDFTQPTGIGDEAWLESGNIFFRKGTTWAEISVVDLDDPPEQVQAALTTLATSVAPKL